jgi:hypothetical protein
MADMPRTITHTETEEAASRTGLDIGRFRPSRAISAIPGGINRFIHAGTVVAVVEEEDARVLFFGLAETLTTWTTARGLLLHSGSADAERLGPWTTARVLALQLADAERPGS